MGTILVVQDFDATYYVTMCLSCYKRMQLDNEEIAEVLAYGIVSIECISCETWDTYTLHRGTYDG